MPSYAPRSPYKELTRPGVSRTLARRGSLAGAGAARWQPLHFIRDVAPALREAGVSGAQVEALLVDNPRRFFAGEKLAALA